MDRTVIATRTQCKDPGTLPVSKVNENTLRLLKANSLQLASREIKVPFDKNAPVEWS